VSRRFGKTPSDSALSFPEDESSFRGNLDPEQLMRLQINRCSITHSSGDLLMFGNSVMALLAMMPSNKRFEVEDLEEEYKTAYQETVFDKINKWRIGTVEHPIMINGRLSPRLEDRVETDYYHLFTLILAKIEEANLSWRIDQINEELGKIKKVAPPPTPTDINGAPLSAELEEPEDE
jgi:hypothetical protein